MDGNPFPQHQHSGYSVHDPHSREDSGISFDDVEPDYENDGNSEVSTEQHHHQQQQAQQQQQQHQHYYQTHDDGQSDGGRHAAYAAYSGGRDEQYAPHTRLPSMDMGIDAIINRPVGL